jgi:hypothetical protein
MAFQWRCTSKSVDRYAGINRILAHEDKRKRQHSIVIVVEVVVVDVVLILVVFCCVADDSDDEEPFLRCRSVLILAVAVANTTMVRSVRSSVCDVSWVR